MRKNIKMETMEETIIKFSVRKILSKLVEVRRKNGERKNDRVKEREKKKRAWDILRTSKRKKNTR